MMRTFFVATASAALLAACATPGDRLYSRDQEAQASVSYVNVAYTPDELARLFVGRTVLVYDARAGNSVEYYDPSGYTLLWHPSSPRVLPGAWKVQGSRTLCTRHGSGAINPLTLGRADAYACEEIVDWSPRIVASLPGNIFSLSPGQTPGGLRPHPRYASIQDVKPAQP